MDDNHQTVSPPATANLDLNDVGDTTVAADSSAPGAVTPLVDLDQPEAYNILGPVHFLDPALCMPFDGAPRAGYRYDERRDADLTADIKAHGIIDPIVVLRRPDKRVIVSGNRRRAIVAHLRSQGIDIPMPVRIASFNDIEAVAYATACNAGRAAPTAMEMARSVRWALENVDENQATLARALAMDQAKVSHLCVLASLPAWVTDIVTDPETLSENFAALIGPGLADDATRQVMKERAERLAAENVTLAGPAAARYLRTGERAAASRELRNADGATFGSLKRDPRGGIALCLSPQWQKVGTDPALIVTRVTEALADAMRGAS
ncbi:ParB/RepB/Spo0J family partition protein [Sphingomonas trueperi]|uniref:ParB/RepB/Spo0J family partition protein n=1 Tax=Sphingomonas trueperi TaxID=53317 RepID=UPI000EB0BD18